MATDSLIRAGKRSEARMDGSAHWLFVDVGFAQSSNKSCGLALNCCAPRVMNFGKLVGDVTCHAKKASCLPLNLLIEAPLSVAFDENGNPTGRKCIDPFGKNHRYWYEQAGVVTMVGAIYLVRALIDAGIEREIRLFEGFASFKGEGKSDHKRDVKDLRYTVKNARNECIRCPEDHADHTRLKSAFTAIDSPKIRHEGVPPVVYTCASWRKMNANLESSCTSGGCADAGR